MKRTAIAMLAVCAGVLMMASPLTASAPAVTAPTITIVGPPVAAYLADVVLTGTAPPGAQVSVYFRDTTVGTFRAQRFAVSGTDGTYTTSYFAGGDYEYFASAAGNSSAIRRTAIVAATCTSSAPAFRPLPVPTTPGSSYPAYAALTATRNGAWAGVAHGSTLASGPVFAVITWHPGAAAPSVLQRYVYNSYSYQIGPTGSVRVVGITPSGGVVAAVQLVNTPSENQDFVGLAWVGSNRYELAHSPTWTSFTPFGISDAGQIAGVARVGTTVSGHYYAVTWASPTAPYQVVADLGDSPDVTTDGAGDIAYRTADADLVRTASGALRTLTVAPPASGGDAALLAGGSGPYIYADSQAGVLRWNPGASTTGDVPYELMTATTSDVPVVGGSRGDLIVNLNASRGLRLRTAAGAYVPVPASTLTPHGDFAGEAVDARGVVAYTTGGLVHFLTCTSPDASTGRQARSGTIADVNGDGRADLLTTRSDGSLLYYPNTGSSVTPYRSATAIGSGWASFAAIAAGDVNGDGKADILAARADGTMSLYLNSGSATHPYGSSNTIGSGWLAFSTWIAADVDGDGRVDILGIKADGSLWFYPNSGNAELPYGSGSPIGSGWRSIATLTAGDVNGDHRGDLIAVSTNGELLLYLAGTTAGHPYTTASEVGSSGWTSFTHVLAGDVDGDGHADLLGTSKAGSLLYFPDSGSTDQPYTTDSQIGTGWQVMTRLF